MERNEVSSLLLLDRQMSWIALNASRWRIQGEGSSVRSFEVLTSIRICDGILEANPATNSTKRKIRESVFQIIWFSI